MNREIAVALTLSTLLGAFIGSVATYFLFISSLERGLQDFRTWKQEAELHLNDLDSSALELAENLAEIENYVSGLNLHIDDVGDDLETQKSQMLSVSDDLSALSQRSDEIVDRLQDLEEMGELWCYVGWWEWEGEDFVTVDFTVNGGVLLIDLYFIGKSSTSWAAVDVYRDQEWINTIGGGGYYADQHSLVITESGQHYLDVVTYNVESLMVGVWYYGQPSSTYS